MKENLNRNKNKYSKTKNISIDNFESNSPLGRAMATSHNIQYEINEGFINREKI